MTQEQSLGLVSVGVINSRVLLTCMSSMAFYSGIASPYLSIVALRWTDVRDGRPPTTRPIRGPRRRVPVRQPVPAIYSTENAQSLGHDRLGIQK